MKAIILFGHGARDIRWREPFDRLAKLWQAQHSDTLVELAFLEMMQPSLEEAVATLLAKGATDITVVPVFFGQGGHLRNDFRCYCMPVRQSSPQLLYALRLPLGRIWLSCKPSSISVLGLSKFLVV
jgi:sirohydrochlorin cobaltochelatase